MPAARSAPPAASAPFRPAIERDRLEYVYSFSLPVNAPSSGPGEVASSGAIRAGDTVGMIASNYVVRDVVRYVPEEHAYRHSRSLSRTLYKLRQKFWLFIVIVVLSGGGGYLAVFLPDAAEAGRQRMKSAAFGDLSNLGALKDGAGGLSDDQKKRLLEELREAGK